MTNPEQWAEELVFDVYAKYCAGQRKDAIEAILSAVREAMEAKWLPITDEVKDGRKIIVWSNRCSGAPVIAWWDTDRFAKKPIPRFMTADRTYGARDLFDVTLYQPLPTPPRSEALSELIASTADQYGDTER